MATKSAAKAAAKHQVKTGKAQVAPTLPAATAAPAFQASDLPAGFRAVRALQLPTLSLKVAGVGRALAFQTGLRVSTVKSKEGEAPATVATVADLETGEQMIYLVPSVVESTLLETYAPPGTDAHPDREDAAARQAVYDLAPLAGKVFYIRNNGKKKPGQRHIDYTVIEGEKS